MSIPEKPISRLRLFLKLKGWIALLVAIPAIVLTLIAMFEGRKADRLESGGLDAVATVTDKRISVSTDSDGDKRTSYHVHFTFTADGQGIADSARVSSSFYRRTEEGQEIPIRYWGEDPRVNEIEAGSTTRTVWITKLIAAALLAGLGYWILNRWQKASRAASVRDRGERRRARVTGHVSTGVRVNKRPMYRLTWEDDDGDTGRSWFVAGHELAQWPEGTEITIYADPRGRIPAVWERDVGPRA